MTRLVALSLLAIQALSGVSAWAQYAEAPFKVIAVEPARALVETVGINNWLNANHARVTEQQTQGAREHLHALIDARVKELYAKQGVLSPPQPDRLLAILYSWAGRLGVFGSDLIYAAVKGDHPVSPPSGPRPPSSVAMSLQGESLVLQSTDPTWRLAVPFHFFPFVLSDSVSTNGQRTQVAVISTGTAPDKASPGYSQATIAFISAQGVSPPEFEREWSQRLQVPLETATKPVDSTQYQSRVAYDPTVRLHKEVVFVSTENGSFAVLYSGLDGTYQANRPHFVDFLRIAKLQ